MEIRIPEELMLVPGEYQSSITILSVLHYKLHLVTHIYHATNTTEFSKYMINITKVGLICQVLDQNVSEVEHFKNVK